VSIEVQGTVECLRKTKPKKNGGLENKRGTNGRRRAGEKSHLCGLQSSGMGTDYMIGKLQTKSQGLEKCICKSLTGEIKNHRSERGLTADQKRIKGKGRGRKSFSTVEKLHYREIVRCGKKEIKELRSQIAIGVKSGWAPKDRTGIDNN